MMSRKFFCTIVISLGICAVKNIEGQGTGMDKGDPHVVEQAPNPNLDNTKPLIPAPQIIGSPDQKLAAPPGPQSKGAAAASKVFFDVAADGQPLGRIEMILYDDVVPKTAMNFKALAKGSCGFGYQGSKMHRVIPGFMVQGGDFETGDGTGGKSIYGKTFNDENFIKKHDQPGTLSMANAGPNTNGAQFFITTVPTPFLDGIHVVFGKVADAKSLDVVKAIEALGSESGETKKTITIAKSGLIPDGEVKCGESGIAGANP